MQQWYYVQNGKQEGPVQLEQLREMASAGKLTTTDLVWNAEMRDWTPAGEIDGIFSSRAVETSEAITAAVVEDATPPESAGELPEIEPGSESLDIGRLLQRTFELTKRHLAEIAIIGLVYFAITSGISVINSVLSSASGAPTFNPFQPQQARDIQIEDLIFPLTAQIILNVVTLYLSLGLYRFCLNLIAGKRTELSMLFGEGKILLRALGATIICTILICIGFLLFIFPGIYLALRFSQFLPAIVDRDLSITDALSYSAEITKNNLLNIFALWFITVIFTIIAIILTCGIGAIVATPMVSIGWMLMYRSLQYGRRALDDRPIGTTNPPAPGSSE